MDQRKTSRSQEIDEKRLHKDLGSSDRTGKLVKLYEDIRVKHAHHGTGEPVKAQTHTVEEFVLEKNRDTASFNADNEFNRAIDEEEGWWRSGGGGGWWRGKEKGGWWRREKEGRVVVEGEGEGEGGGVVVEGEGNGGGVLVGKERRGVGGEGKERRGVGGGGKERRGGGCGVEGGGEREKGW